MVFLLVFNFRYSDPLALHKSHIKILCSFSFRMRVIRKVLLIRSVLKLSCCVKLRMFGFSQHLSLGLYRENERIICNKQVSVPTLSSTSHMPMSCHAEVSSYHIVSHRKPKKCCRYSGSAHTLYRSLIYLRSWRRCPLLSC